MLLEQILCSEPLALEEQAPERDRIFRNLFRLYRILCMMRYDRRPKESVNSMKRRLHTAAFAGSSFGSKGTSLHTFNDDAAISAAVVLMYGFRKRHGERRLKQGL